ncbi:MAG: Uma2 family endonuclease [Defluviitaleaceae bacterium]|nr:Uma2 family endonuclease [Defluviitaleaceae bacterium]
MTYMQLDYLQMSTPHERHNEMTEVIGGELYILSKQTKMYLRTENKGLCYEPNPLNSNLPRLIDVENITDAAELNDFETFIPDILVFNKNKKMLSENTTKIAGYPDLVIEVWSKWNDKKERLRKQISYSTGKNTEHWYLTQNSNKIECWFEDKQLPNKSLKKVLTTQGGLKLDLRELAL